MNDYRNLVVAVQSIIIILYFLSTEIICDGMLLSLVSLNTSALTFLLQSQQWSVSGALQHSLLFFEVTNIFSVWNSGREHGHILGLNPQPSASVASTKCQYLSDCFSLFHCYNVRPKYTTEAGMNSIPSADFFFICICTSLSLFFPTQYLNSSCFILITAFLGGIVIY